MNRITTFLWCDGQAEEAANFYTSLLPDSHVDGVHRAPSDNPSNKEGDVYLVEFTLMGSSFAALNGGAQFPYSEAISFQIPTDDQAETDRLSDALIANGGSQGNCGWLKDRWGMSWQVTPKRLFELLASPDADVARRVSQAMQSMYRIDIAKLEDAAAAEVGHA